MPRMGPEHQAHQSLRRIDFLFTHLMTFPLSVPLGTKRSDDRAIPQSLKS